MSPSRRSWQVALATLVAGASVPGVVHAAGAFDPAIEASNYSKINERFDHVVSKPDYQVKLRTESAEATAELAAIRAKDPERNPDGVCASYAADCAGDIRLADWAQDGHGIVRDVLYTNRNGATIPGRVWATRAGPAKRPAVVLSSGGLAPQTLYWFGAAALAKAGYVVLTYDVQAQGRADVRGEAPDDKSLFPFDGTRVSQTDGVEDAMGFLLSTPGKPYVPRPSCLSGTSHAAKHARRVKAGLNTAYDPMWDLIDTKRIGLVGHSLSAYGVSFVGQKDPRVSAIVAWDNLEEPAVAAGGKGPLPCAKFPETRTPPPITKPALGLSADYHQPPEPNTELPDPAAKSRGFRAYRKAGVDSGQVVLRGGTHYEFSFLPAANWPASLRGSDATVWYTIAWLDRYLKRDPTADRRLLTDRWRRDQAEGAVDPHGDANMFSFYSPSGFDFRRSSGGGVACADLRAGCSALSAADGVGPNWSYVSFANTRDVATPAPATRSHTVTVPRTLSLRGSKRRLAVRLRLVASTRVRIRVVRAGASRAIARVSRRMTPGGHRVTLTLPRRTRTGVYRVETTLRPAGGPSIRIARVRVKA